MCESCRRYTTVKVSQARLASSRELLVMLFKVGSTNTDREANKMVVGQAIDAVNKIMYYEETWERETEQPLSLLSV